jgi:tetratricopeptide (TPR) repeat protein
LTKAAELCEQTGNAKGAAAAYFGWARLLMYQGNLEQALLFYDKAKEKIQQEFDLAMLKWTLGGSASNYAYMGHWEEVVKEGEKLLRLCEEYADNDLISNGLWYLGWAYLIKGDLVRGVQYCELSLEKARTPAIRTWAQMVVAYAWCRSGEVKKGCEMLLQLVPVVRASGFLAMEADVTVHLGEGQWLAGEYDQARETLEGALKLAEEGGMKYFAGRACRLLGEVHLKTDPVLGAEHFEKAIAVLRAIKSENELALAYAGYGRLLKQQGDFAQARTYLTQALEIFERLGILIEPDKVKQELIEAGA